MTRSEKREQAIRNNPKNVRFEDLDLFLRSYDFVGEPASSHFTYRHPRYTDLRITVVKPHGGVNQVKVVYVREAIVLVDQIRSRRLAEVRQ
ncbi:MAG: hypothetical protein ACYDAR_10090 [Thermomicrobiales bacterium]